MRHTGFLSTYNRVIAHWRPRSELDYQNHPLSQSMLGFFGAGEATFIQRFVNLTDADRTTYQS